MSDSSINPVKIKQIEILYENGVRIIVPETKAPTVGAKFFKIINNDNVDFKIIEPKQKKKITDFFKL